MNELSLFSGAGGGLLASRLLGWTTICGVEIEPYCREILALRQREGYLDPFPIWDDVSTFEGIPWRGVVDVISGGFPCQDISCAGKRAGLGGNRSGLWFQMLRIIGEVQPTYVFIENSPNLRNRGLDVVLKGLAGLGYDAAWGVLGAWHVGAPHRRNRMWIVAAHPDLRRQRDVPQHAEVAGASKAERIHKGAQTADAHSDDVRIKPRRSCGESGDRTTQYRDAIPWRRLPDLTRMDDGMADRVVDRIKATGNGQVPAVAATAWSILSETMT